MDELEKIQELSGISDTVAQYLDNQYYKSELVAEDDASYQSILLQCYTIILQELQELGIELVVPYDNALESYYLGDGFTALYQLLNADYLTRLFTTYQGYKLPIQAIFEGDTDIALEDMEEDYIHSFLVQYKIMNKDDPLLEKIDRITDLIISNYLLKEHILAILDNSVPSSEISSDDTELMVQYVNKIVTGQQMFSDIVHFLINNDPTLNKDYLEQAIRLYDFEKITGVDVKKYCWAVMSKDAELSEQEKRIKTQILFEHERNQTHHIEYYMTTKNIPTRENLVELISHHVEPESTQEQYTKDFQEMITKAEPYHIFTPDMLQYLYKLNDLILSNIYKS